MSFESNIGTPQKRVKLNENSTLDSQEHRLVKMSILNKLLQGTLGQKQTPKPPNPTLVSEFELPL